MGAAEGAAVAQGLSGLGGNIINSGALAFNTQQAMKNFAWQKYGMMANLLLQGDTWKREDTAIQRRVADLKAAGLSPVLAAGSAASSSPAMRVEAPQNQAQIPYNLIKSNVGASILQAMQAKSQTELMDAQRLKIDQQRMLDLLMQPHKLKYLDAKTSDTYQKIVKQAMDNYWYKITGVAPGSSEAGRTVSDTTRILQTIIQGAVNATQKK